MAQAYRNGEVRELENSPVFMCMVCVIMLYLVCLQLCGVACGAK